MAERRMFAKQIVLSDAFLDMPLSARCLYFTLGMFADDDGFVNNPKAIMRQCGTTEDDIKILLAKKFLIAFESGVIVIKHWKINNYLRNDRYKETNYTEEKNKLEIEKNGTYSLGIPAMGIPSIVKDSIDKDRINNNIVVIENNTTTITKEKKFVKPTVEEIKNYCLERKNRIDAEHFFDYYESKGWKIGKCPMKSWQAAIRTWERNNIEGNKSDGNNVNGEKYDRENGWF
jgi:hypothetical protein